MFPGFRATSAKHSFTLTDHLFALYFLYKCAPINALQGASVIRMLQSLMGKEAFFQGVSKYLKKYTFRNAKTDDLWTELGQVSNLSKMLINVFYMAVKLNRANFISLI